MTIRPLIGVTRPNRGEWLSFGCAWVSLWLCGARPVAVSPRATRQDLTLHGLLLTGGGDVHPALFRAAPKAGYVYDQTREAVELAWLRRARAEDLPTLGICRGAQLMNVAAGGALHMDLAVAYAGVRYPAHWLEQLYFRKKVRLAPGSRLAAIVGAGDLKVNSIHSQAVGEVGEGLVVTGWETNGVIQAIEDPGRRFWLGVQFHPEFLFYQRRFRLIFRAFVAAAAAFAAQRQAADEDARIPAEATGAKGA